MKIIKNRHVVTKQRMPSIKTVIKNIESALASEVDPKGRTQLERALDYWNRRRNETNNIQRR